MTQESTQSQVEVKVASNALSGPGMRLRVAREARNISLEEVAKHLRLTLPRLTLIEADNYAEMGASAFARGYLRGYARFLGICEAEILKNFEDLNLQSGIQSNKPRLINEKMIQHVTHPVARWFGYLVLLVVVIVGGAWWHNHSSADQGAIPVLSESNLQGGSQVSTPENMAGSAKIDPQNELPVKVTSIDNAASKEEIASETKAITSDAVQKSPVTGQTKRSLDRSVIGDE